MLALQNAKCVLAVENRASKGFHQNVPTGQMRVHNRIPKLLSNSFI